MMESFLGWTAAAWGVVMALAPLLQIRRMIRRRSSQDVSLGYFAVLLPGFGLWIAYGLVRDDWALVVPNMVAVLISVITMAIALWLRRARHAPAADETRSMLT